MTEIVFKKIFESTMNNNKIKKLNELYFTSKDKNITLQPLRKAGHAVCAKDYKLYVFGGDDVMPNQLWIYDTRKKEWDCVMSNDSSPQGPGPIAPSLVCDTFHPRLLLFGGWIGHCVINDLWAFHYCMYFWIPKNNEKKKVTLKWERLTQYGDIPAARSNHVCEVINHQMILFGGLDDDKVLDDLHVMCTKTCVWTKINDMKEPKPRARRSHASCLVNDRMVIFGGGCESFSLNDMWMLDLDNRMWIEIDYKSIDIPSSRIFPILEYLNGNLYLYGGRYGKIRIGDLWEFDWERRFWRKLRDYSRGISGHQSAIVELENCKQGILIFGGDCGIKLNELWQLEMESLTLKRNLYTFFTRRKNDFYDIKFEFYI